VQNKNEQQQVIPDGKETTKMERLSSIKKLSRNLAHKISVKRGAKIKKMIMHELKRYWMKIIKLA
jgi:NAD+--asparagine ADP-ribosyltransferase